MLALLALLLAKAALGLLRAHLYNAVRRHGQASDVRAELEGKAGEGHAGRLQEAGGDVGENTTP